MTKRMLRKYGAPRQRALVVVGDLQRSGVASSLTGRGDEGGTDPDSNILLG